MNRIFVASLGTFESVGSTELQNAGKAGLITIQGKISAVLGTVLVCKFLFPVYRRIEKDRECFLWL